MPRRCGGWRAAACTRALLRVRASCACAHGTAWPSGDRELHGIARACRWAVQSDDVQLCQLSRGGVSRRCVCAESRRSPMRDAGTPPASWPCACAHSSAGTRSRAWDAEAHAQAMRMRTCAFEQGRVSCDAPRFHTGTSASACKRRVRARRGADSPQVPGRGLSPGERAERVLGRLDHPRMVHLRMRMSQCRRMRMMCACA